MKKLNLKTVLCAAIVTNTSLPTNAESIQDSYGLTGISVTSAHAHENERAGFFWAIPAIGAAAATGLSLAAYLHNARSGGGTNIVMQEPNPGPEAHELPLPPTLIGAAATQIARHAEDVGRAAARSNQNRATRLANSLGILASGFSLYQGASTAHDEYWNPNNGTINWERANGNVMRAVGSAGAILAYPTAPNSATISNMIGSAAKALRTGNTIDQWCAAAGCGLSTFNMYNRHHNNGNMLLGGQITSVCMSLACSLMGADDDL